MFRVLKPHYEKTGEVTHSPEGATHWWRVEFEMLGLARDMQEAKRLYPVGYWNGFSHVLEAL